MTHPATAPDPSAGARPVRKAVIPPPGWAPGSCPPPRRRRRRCCRSSTRPAIQYVVEEAVAAGLDDVLMITGRSKRALEDHFDRALELEAALEAKGDTAAARRVRASAELADVHYVRQGDPRGLGHAVLCARGPRR